MDIEYILKLIANNGFPLVLSIYLVMKLEYFINELVKNQVEKFFNNQAKRLSLFLEIEQMIRSIGEVTVEVKKSQISFGTKLKFAWVWLPKKWDNRPKNSIVLTFSVARHIENKQIVQVVEPYPGRWTHHIIIQNKKDLNNDVYKWLHEAYTFSLDRE